MLQKTTNRGIKSNLFKLVYMAALMSTIDFELVALENPGAPYRSATYLGRGNTGIADAKDQEAIFYNPAFLAEGEGIYKKIVLASPFLDISTRTKGIYEDITVKKKEQVDVFKDSIGKPFHIGANSLTALVFRRAALGALVTADMDFVLAKDPEYGGLESVVGGLNANQIVNFAVAEKFFQDRLMIGGTLNYIIHQENSLKANIMDAQNISKASSELSSGSGAGADFGAVWRFDGKSKKPTGHTFGLSIKNIGDTVFYSDETGEEFGRFSQTINLGYCYSINTIASGFKFLADLNDLSSSYYDTMYKKLNMGVQVDVANRIGVTAGLKQGYLTSGFYFDLWVIRADVGVYTEEKGDKLGNRPDERFYLRLVAGF